MKRCYDKSLSPNYTGCTCKDKEVSKKNFYSYSAGNTRLYDSWADKSKCKNDEVDTDPCNYRETDNCECPLITSYTEKICDCYNLYNYNFGKEIIEIISGNSNEIILNKDDCEIRADVVVGDEKGCSIWGEVTDKCNKPVEKAVVTLLKPQIIRGMCKYIKINSTLTDCYGYYQFYIPECEKICEYKITLGKPIC